MISASPVGNAWDAKRYDDSQSFVWKFGANVVEYLAPQAGERILDLGSGTGHLAAQIAASGATVIGVDGSDAMVREARSLYRDLAFYHVDARTLVHAARIAPESKAAPLLAEASFDAVFSNATLHWIPEAQTVIDGVARVLRPGGRFVAEMGGRSNVAIVHRAIAEARAELGYEPRASVLFFPSIAQYAALLESGGFEIAAMQLFGRPTPLEGEHGLADWARTFASNEIDDIAEADRDKFFATLERIGKPHLHDGTQWIADYRRLRFSARRI